MLFEKALENILTTQKDCKPEDGSRSPSFKELFPSGELTKENDRANEEDRFCGLYGAQKSACF
jgi:hypothetical protein